MELVTSFIPEATVKGRALAADQEFQRQLKKWEFAIEKQNLFREDIRDLVELTVGRMDIYHLVGALLLKFCIIFYCENDMLAGEKGKYPTWLVSLFMISNFGAIGFLALAVWLSMHASVASHATGVRLLLRIIRPDIPGADAIKNLSAPIISWLSGSKSQPPSESIPAAVQSTDDRNHFREFLQRQRVWLCYDAYARLCMCLGMNAMLTALSYYIIGRISVKDAVAAVSCLFGLQMVSVLLLVLDVQHERPFTSQDRERCFFARAITNRYEGIALFMLQVFPPLYALILDWCWPGKGSHLCRVLSTISFVLHAGWLEYLYRMNTRSTEDLLPRRLRAVGFMDVMSPDELELGAEDAAKDLKKADEQLRTCMESGNQMHMLESFRDELVSQVQSARHIRSIAFAAEQPVQADSPQETREGPRGSALERSRQSVRIQREALDRVLRQALHLLTVFKDVYFLWKTAPQILGSSKALLAVDGLMPAEQTQLKQILEEIQKQYGELRQQMQSGIQRGDERIYFAMGAIAEEDPLPVVAVEDEDPNTRELVIRWYRPEDRFTVLLERPAGRRGTTFSEAVTDHLAWRQSRELFLAGQGSFSLKESGFEFSAARNYTLSASAIQDGTNIQLAENSSQQTPAAESYSRHLALPRLEDRLPRDIVRFFTRGCMLLWLLAALSHLTHGLTQEQSLEPPVLETQQLSVKWPSPAALFEISALHCANNSALLVSSRFGLYGAQWQPSALDTFEQVASQPASSVACEGDLCSAFMRSPSGQEEWILAPVTQTFVPLRDSLTVPIPAAWRTMSARWQPCSLAFAPCESAVLAGWTGEEVVIAEAYRTTPAGAWQLQPSLSLQPESAVCRNERAAVSCSAASALTRYDDVQALHLGPGRILTVLLSKGRLDAWDFVSGAFLGKWLVGQGNYTAMCIREDHAVLARRGGRQGPQLHVAALPSVLSKAA